MKKYLLAIIIIIILSAGVVVGLILLKSNKQFNQKAFNQNGTATVTISPATASIDLNTPQTVSVNFNTGGVLVNGISMQIDYSNIGIKASDIIINSDLLQQGWTCPVKSVSSDGSTDNIKIGCAFTTAGTGYSNNSDTTIATFTITPSQVPPVNPVIFSFDSDPNLTVITLASDASDIALTPSSTGSFTINGAISQSPTPTPTVIVSTPTPTPSLIAAATDTPVPTSTATTAPTSTATAAPTATATSSSSTALPTASPNTNLPVTGFDTPTIVGGGIGVTLLMFAAAALIL
ncbi:MAG TPA: hypothetical protein VG895_01010 [Patescibacteria group bacterium]|nr:hypothetical protein [Patescibacteria group bacterium]